MKSLKIIISLLISCFLCFSSSFAEENPSLNPKTILEFSILPVPTPVSIEKLNLLQTIKCYYSKDKYSAVIGTTYLLKSRSDWEKYCGSIPPPVPPVDFHKKIIILNLQHDWIPVRFEILDVNKEDNRITIEANITKGGSPIKRDREYIEMVTKYYPTAIAINKTSLPIEWNIMKINHHYPK